MRARRRSRRRSSRCSKPSARPRRRSSAVAASGRRCAGPWAGYYEIRVTGPGRTHYRLFCRLDNGTAAELAERGFDQPQIVVINGLYKAHRTEFSDAEYRKHVRDLGDDYLAQLPRPIASDD